MSNLFCECSSTLGNTGKPSTQRVVKDGTFLIAVPLVADDGTTNQILSSDTLDSTYIDGKINQADYSKRWYPIGKFENVEDVRADPVTESFSDGSSIVTQQGVRTFTGWLLRYSSAYIAQLEAWAGCRAFGVYAVDDCGDLIGSINSDCTALLPIRVNENSWYADLLKESDTVGGKVQLRFEFSQLERDSSLRLIKANEMSYDLTTIAGLIDVTATISGESTTGFVAALTIKYDAFQTDVDVVGWVTADFDLYNTTTSSSIVITSATEAPDGTYTFVIPAQTAADILRLRTSSTRTGYWIEQLITIP